MFSNSVLHLNESQSISGDLHVYIPDKSSLESVNNDFQKIYSEKPQNDKSYWLFDISSYVSLESWQTYFQSLEVNLNEDLYLYSFTNETKDQVLIWECYQIHPTKPKKIALYGTWSKQNGLSINSNEKWIRRKDLEVCTYTLKLKLLFLGWHNVMPGLMVNFVATITHRLMSVPVGLH